jgi:putative ABC transport system permease protein
MRLLFTIISTAFWSLRRNKMRTGLTMLGIIVGVAAAISMVSLGQGAIASTEEEIAAMGTNLLTIMPGAKVFGGFRGAAGGVVSMVPEDAEAIRRECPAVKLVSPGVRTAVQVIYQNQNIPTTLQGGSVEWLAIRNWKMASGSFFDAEQERRDNKVCVLGAKVADTLFGGRDPVGAAVRINRVPFQVIGLLERKGQSSGGQNQDDLVVVPWSAGMRRVMGITHLTMMLASAVDANNLDTAKTQVISVLRRRHHLLLNEEDDFTVQTQRELADTQQTLAKVLLWMVVATAVIALLVGGVGVMNIMLVSVLERTREIGLRMAVGARPRDVLLQFLGETVMLTSCGGLIGILMGVGLAWAFPVVLGWPTQVNALPVITAFVFSACIGIGFGFYPAFRASRLDPIQALHFR